ncbi:EAL domain-containing protein [Pusillimonas sp. CC-YST705]|uniref:EAL domain-containing protein n=1 Tax=Mesopusillimonas faecipullorum TaxID=2755040 RepID=A0ABS8CA30_9BURK|nr:EAL domain-containing protein [Mesopusillimonas faecipullorum]MCB5362848.1 EAL domain-containing protein [Mesopusillimonas faecipullorum]
MLARHRSVTPRLIIELDAFALSAQAQRDYGNDIVSLCRRLHSEFGMRVGLRALTQQIEVMYRLGELACAYVKLGEDFIDLLQGSTGARELLRALVRTARTGGIEVVTMRVSDGDEREWLRREGVGSLQLERAH